MAHARSHSPEDTWPPALDSPPRPQPRQPHPARESEPASTGECDDRLAVFWLFGVCCRTAGGVNLLWRSPTWSRSEKLLGTLVLPGGLLWAFSLAPGQVAAPGGMSLTGWSVWGAVALLLPLASAAVLVSRRRRFHGIPLDEGA